jgi:tetrahydromethanopterin S-methyltransferase subunit G
VKNIPPFFFSSFVNDDVNFCDNGEKGGTDICILYSVVVYNIYIHVI